jgi:hypothetical protein
MRSITSRLSTILGSFFVALLVLTQFSQVKAGPGPVAVATAIISGTVVAAPTATPVAAPTATLVPTSTPSPIYEIRNGGFGVKDICDKSFWTIGNWYALSPPGRNCYITLGGKLGSVPGTTPITTTSYIEQTFIVDPTNPSLSFYLQPTSNKPGTAYPAQLVSLYDSTGALIYQKSRNSDTPEDCGFLFHQSLQGYGGQAVRLRISATVSPAPDAPTISTLSVDFDGFSWDCSGPTPDDAPPTRW